MALAAKTQTTVRVLKSLQMKMHLDLSIAEGEYSSEDNEFQDSVALISSSDKEM